MLTGHGAISTTGYLYGTQPALAGALHDKLLAAGLADGVKPSFETIQAIMPILANSGLDKTDACLLQAWLGGAHDLFDDDFGATSAALSAQQFCKLIDSNKPSSIEQAFSPLVRGVYGCTLRECAIDALEKIDAKAAALVLSAGKAKAKASAKKQDEEAEADAEKLREKVALPLKVGVGTVLLVAGIVLALKLSK